LKPLILEHYFGAVDLRVAKNDRDDIVGFIGVADGNVEMLFIPVTIQDACFRAVERFQFKAQ